MNDQHHKSGKLTVDPTLANRYPDKLFAEKAARAQAFLNAHPLPEGFTLDPTIDSSRGNVGLEEKRAAAVVAIEKYGLPEKTGGKQGS